MAGYADFRDGYIQWPAELGIRPTGNKNEKNKHGFFNKRRTYLGRCPCLNDECQSYAVFYDDDDTICETQTLAIRNEVVKLVEMYLDTQSKILRLRETLNQQLNNLTQPKRVSLDRSKDVQLLYTVLSALPLAIQQLLILNDHIHSSRTVEFEWGEEKININWIECPMYNILIEDEDSLPEGYFDDLLDYLDDDT